MRNLTIAVAGILASAAAGAANIDLYVAGASAQSAFWKADMGTSVCGGAANITTYTLNGVSGISNEAWRCTAPAAVAGTTIAAGDRVTVHYNSQFGTISGVAALVHPTVAKRLYVNPDSPDCSAPVAATPPAVGFVSSCTILTYDGNNETFTSTSTGAFGTADAAPMYISPNALPADVGVLDVEIKHWQLAANWQVGVPAFGAVPTAADIAAIPVAATVVNGQIFSLITNNASPIAAKGNISKASAAAILTGVYNVWGDVPEVGGGNTTPIKLCRREQGSGTQVAASIFFSGLECGRSTTPIVTAAAQGQLSVANGGGGVTEETSTGNVRTCVQGNTGAVGFTSLGVNAANYTTLALDGVQANAHNAAAGFYPYAFEDVVYNQSAASGAAQGARDLATLFINNARKATSLTSQIESTATQNANGNWSATAPKSNYALPFLGVNTKSVANASTLTQAVTALGLRNGDNCKVLFNSNTL